MPEIGETLRNARMRAHIDVSEIESQTKIRAKYLRALENEEWSLLPGPTFVKSFLRTYAQALGLDGAALVEEYRASYEDPSDQPPEPIVSSPRRAAGGGRGSIGPSRVSRAYVIGVAVISLVILLLIVGLLTGGGSSTTTTATAPTASTHRHRPAHGRRAVRGAASTQTQTSSIVSVAMQATGAVYICLLGEGGHTLIAGKTLEAGQKTATYRGRRFELTLGNNAVKLTIDGTPRSVPASSAAIGYAITKAGRRTLSPGHLPTCT